MNWGSWGDFWAMGGQAWYVWGSYGATVALMLAEGWLVTQRLRDARGQARRAFDEGAGADEGDAR